MIKLQEYIKSTLNMLIKSRQEIWVFPQVLQKLGYKKLQMKKLRTMATLIN